MPDYRSRRYASWERSSTLPMHNIWSANYIVHSGCNFRGFGRYIYCLHIILACCPSVLERKPGAYLDGFRHYGFQKSGRVLRLSFLIPSKMCSSSAPCMESPPSSEAWAANQACRGLPEYGGMGTGTGVMPCCATAMRIREMRAERTGSRVSTGGREGGKRRGRTRKRCR